jgi:AraC-like DNA-binding protein
VIRLSPLLREFVLAFLAYPPEEATTPTAARLIAVVLDQLAAEPAAPLHLPMPASARLRDAVSAAMADPAHPLCLSEAAHRAALSERSFERHFSAETGLAYRAWLRQARLMKAVEWLSLGMQVNEIADRPGPEGPSAFVATFRKAFSVSPGRDFSGVKLHSDAESTLRPA